MTPDDIEVIHEMLSDPDVMRYWPRPHTREESEQWIANQLRRYAAEGCGYWLAIDTQLDEPVGQAGVLMSEVDGQLLPGIGYIFRKQFWSKGYATEAAAACLEWSRKRHSRTICLVQPRNEPSIRVALRLGLQPGNQIDYKGLPHIVFAEPS